jgi:hypothetical protein
MKRHFGSWTTRSFLGSGTTLSDSEHHLLSLLVAELPPPLRSKVECQFESYNLVQREVDKRTLNFYRSRAWGRGLLPVTPVLQSKIEVAPLVRLSLKVAGQAALLHAVLTAVGGRAFSVSFSRVVARNTRPEDYAIAKVTQAWLSNFDDAAGAA